MALTLALLAPPNPAISQEAAHTHTDAGAREDAPDQLTSDIVVIGQRGEVVTDIEPLATFNARAIEATGATSIDELLRTIRGITEAADGEPPIFLLNAQRVSGYEEIGNLPPEAIEKVEVLPEPVALRYGYPPTRRVVNFITKRRFRQLSLKYVVGTATRGGADTVNPHLDLTRLRDDKRFTLSLDAHHTDALSQSSRHVLPDPDVPFDAIGNVTGVRAGGEIDPTLSALAGQVTTIAPVPAGAAPTLSGFAAGANMPRLYDLSPFHDLAPANDTLHGELVMANRIGHGIAGSLTLTADHAHERSVYGPSSATLLVPADNPFSPFSNDVLLQRYFTEGPLLGARLDTTTLHAGGLLRGAWRGWQWDLTGTLDGQRRVGLSDAYTDTALANAAIAAGANPFQPLPSALVGNVRANHTVQTTHGAAAKFVTNNRPVRLPAGPVTVTATLEVERTGSSGRTTGATTYDVAFARTRIEGAATLDVPVASRKAGVLSWLGKMSINASTARRHVEGFGDLSDATAGITWAPFKPIQFLLQYKTSAAAPTLDQVATPQAVALQANVFNFATGRSDIVTLLTGGNPDLVAEHRRVRSLGVTLKPFAKSELRLGATYEATTVRNGVQTIYALTPATLAGLPDLFVRDASGALTSVAFRPVNVAREEQQTLNITLNANGQIGHAKPPAQSNGKPAERPSFYGGLGPSIRFADRLTLRPGTTPLNLLAGDTLTGATTPRIAGYGYGGLNYLGNGGTFDFDCLGGGRVRGAVPAADLSFGALCRLNVSGSLSLHHVFSHQTWTRHFIVKLSVDNLFDAHPSVRAADNTTPYRYQADLLDPVGRRVSLTLRKAL
ncbi:TonB-dependent receptor [Sphingomonas sp. BAUL-RG-20F-R05-02]|uniref:TonB-dependent receptor n=1 Tax=Sphingomonas sp. BAUL-RG-20F-R05-02 TaxID=2914830 RepID=UPI001F571B36|nr:TonB-dependent receptor [Sphingomonas sp. BAUL-RG-20F-R05-02]